MKKWIAILAFWAVAMGANAASMQQLPQLTVQDQFDKPVVVDGQLEWLLLSSDKASGETVKNVLNKLGLTDLKAQKGVYLADISAMPGFITKMFAVPKMQDYAFKIGLIYDEEQLNGWPREEDKVTALRLKDGHIEEISYPASEQELENWLKGVLEK
ncbi:MULTISPECIES: hypothetical protein [Thiomicrorhabdus]|uniref:FAD/FMN-containing dehydrogenase n=1 Tax=Thiomicrorhabdus heinhorstiae TaxID=2748010 RepID=A0ABS0BWZ9_9GAMM|nr:MULTISPECIES: hypothetical protein [Thiomicrorhabdus]MBF6057590.1 hypothetical protein [Thiomicrorhabdus heinhorstiae]